ncbi:AP complex mu/sigma subunit [Penicillium verhagenii]|nr:AP complex mu/sigma subunit [Penicillium verhagenii]
MPVYMIHGFRWPRAGFTGIRVYVVLHNLEEAAAEYIQQPLTSELLTESFQKTQPDLIARLPELRFIEQYDPYDETSNTVSQDYAYVASKVLTIPDGGASVPDSAGPGLNIADCVEQGSGLSQDESEALEELRNRLAPEEKIGWFMVYNGDPDRYYPTSEEEEDSEEEYYDDEDSYVDEKSTAPSEAATEPSTPVSYTFANDRIFTVSIDKTLESDELIIGIIIGFLAYSKTHPPGDRVLTMVLSFILVQNRQGKTRLAKWYAPYSDEEKVKLKGEVHRLVAPRDQKYQSNFVEFRRSTKVVYRRYAGLFFCVCVDANDNELAYLEAIHFFVEVLDQFFGNVCELDLVFNFYKVYAILDEVFLAGEIEETSKQVVLTRLEHLDKLE